MLSIIQYKLLYVTHLFCVSDHFQMVLDLWFMQSFVVHQQHNAYVFVSYYFIYDKT